MKQFGLALGLGLAGLLLAVFLLGWFDVGAAELRAEKTTIALEQARALAPLWLTVKRVLLVALGVLGSAVALLSLAAGLSGLASVPNVVRWGWVKSWLVKPTRHGAQYPALAAPDGLGHIRIVNPVNEPGAQRVAALTTGLLPDTRLQGSAVRQILRADDPQAMLPEPEGSKVLTLADAVEVDPRTNPHWLMIGKTGSGKSTGMRHVLTIMANRYPSEFVICEPNRGNWKDATHAWTVEGIAGAVQAVYDEQNRRADLLANHSTAEHVMDLPGEHLPYLCLLFAEMDATMDNLYKLDRAQHKTTLVQLRDIARMGRKQGVCLFAESQAGLADVLDPNIARNFANIFLFSGSQQTAKTLGVSDLVQLPKLLPGQAFSMTHEGVVEFPVAQRPTLKRSRLYQERERLLLPVDAEADGLGANDLPSTEGAGTGTVLEPAVPAAAALFAASATVLEPVPAVPVPESPKRIPRRAPTPVEAAAMRAHYRRTGSKTAVCFAFYGWKNGDCWDWVGQAIRGEI